MFDITSSKLLILAVVALIVVGPKDLPILLRTIGKYLGIIRRHAAEFGHREIKQHDVKRLLLREPECLTSIGGAA